MKLRWSQEAIKDFEDLVDFTAGRWPSKTNSTAQNVMSQLRLLKTFPLMGKPTERPSVRALILKNLPYVCLYQPQEEVILLLHIYHGAQDYKV